MSEMKGTLYLIRGVSGSGKTTLARMLEQTLRAETLVVAADDYMIDEYGEYHFDPDELPEAHKWCQKRVERNMEAGVPNIIVHNTFTMLWEARPYYKMADANEYQVIVYRCENVLPNVHDVPLKTVVAQHRRMENF